VFGFVLVRLFFFPCFSVVSAVCTLASGAALQVFLSLFCVSLTVLPDVNNKNSAIQVAWTVPPASARNRDIIMSSGKDRLSLPASQISLVAHESDQISLACAHS